MVRTPTSGRCSGCFLGTCSIGTEITVGPFLERAPDVNQAANIFLSVSHRCVTRVTFRPSLFLHTFLPVHQCVQVVGLTTCFITCHSRTSCVREVFARKDVPCAVVMKLVADWPYYAENHSRTSNQSREAAWPNGKS